jgi:hypothetical protein
MGPSSLRAISSLSLDVCALLPFPVPAWSRGSCSSSSMRLVSLSPGSRDSLGYLLDGLQASGRGGPAGGECCLRSFLWSEGQGSGKFCSCGHGLWDFVLWLFLVSPSGFFPFSPLLCRIAEWETSPIVTGPSALCALACHQTHLGPSSHSSLLFVK